MSTNNITEKKLFSDRLKLLRGNQKKAVFARRLGIPPPVYQRYEDGRLPSAENLSVISERCSVSTDWLLGRSESRYEQDGSAIIGAPQKIGSGTMPENLYLRELPEEYLTNEITRLWSEEYPIMPEGRPKLNTIRRCLNMLTELQERTIDKITGRVRPLPVNKKSSVD